MNGNYDNNYQHSWFRSAGRFDGGKGKSVVGETEQKCHLLLDEEQHEGQASSYNIPPSAVEVNCNA